MDAVRAKLEELIEARGDSYAGISVLLGKNPAYIQQFIKRGTPRRLSEEDRQILARYFGVAEEVLGGLTTRGEVGTEDKALAPVPVLPLGASAGYGSLDESERPTSNIKFDLKWLRALGVKSNRISIVHVEGESMAPTLCDGDEIMVDHDDGQTDFRDGIYVLRMDGVLVVKRVSRGPLRGQFSVGSDNPLYPSWTDIDHNLIEVIGRVVWLGRRLQRRT